MASEFQVPEGMVGVVATTSLNLSEISREMLRVTETLKSNGSLTREWTNLLEAVASAEDAWIRLGIAVKRWRKPKTDSDERGNDDGRLRSAQASRTASGHGNPGEP